MSDLKTHGPLVLLLLRRKGRHVGRRKSVNLRGRTDPGVTRRPRLKSGYLLLKNRGITYLMLKFRRLRKRRALYSIKQMKERFLKNYMKTKPRRKH